jgi:outer membrane biogenesis lipoprotein LolB
MVDALKRAAKLLGPDGAIVDLRPASHCLHELSIVQGRRRQIIGRYHHELNSGFRAADKALRQACMEGFRWQAHLQRSYRLRFSNLRELGQYVRTHVKGQLAPESRAVLRIEWSRRGRGNWLELRELFQVNILRPWPPSRKPLLRGER